jgi:hypothetical protein
MMTPLEFFTITDAPETGAATTEPVIVLVETESPLPLDPPHAAKDAMVTIRRKLIMLLVCECMF